MSRRLTIRGAYAGIWRLYLGWTPRLLLIGVVVFIPVGLLHALAATVEDGAIEFGSFAEILGTAVALIVLSITGLLGEVFYTGAIAALMTGEHESHEPPKLGEIAREVEYGRLIAIDVIYAVVVAIGFLLLFAPGVIAFVFLALAAPIVEIEGSTRPRRPPAQCRPRPRQVLDGSGGPAADRADRRRPDPTPDQHPPPPDRERVRRRLDR